MPNLRPIVERLVERQDADGHTDRAFAELLGIDRSQWTLIRLGYRDLGLKPLVGAIRAYPEIGDLFNRAVKEGSDLAEPVAS